jgi:carbon monoxide dehydrogenase subunit G
MQIDNEFTVNVAIGEAWTVLTDLEGIAPCLPGAQLTGVDDDVFTGKVKIKVGPVISNYAGTARFIEKDDATYRAVIDAKGKDSRGNGSAAAMISAQLRAEGDSTIVSVNTELNITGKIAQFGSGMIKEVSAKLLGQFADNLETKLLAPNAAEPPSATTETPPLAAETAGPSARPTTAPVDAAFTHRTITPTVEPEPLDLMAVAGSSVYKRLIPVAVAGIIALALLIYRRKR